jgi:RNA polymerase sigma-70 factor (ECF subfamily)
MARNVFSDHYQSVKNKHSDYVDVEKMSDHLKVEDSMDQEEKERLLHKSLSMLNNEQRELLILTRFQQMKYEDVASIMDTTVANIKVKVHRAIQKLKDHYFQLEKI